jgi:hypothetical protein
MGIASGIKGLFGGGVDAVSAIGTVGNVLDNLFTSKDEKLTHEEIRMRIAQQPHMVQTEINKLEAGSRFAFAACWRPAIGWVCALGLFNFFIINPWIQWFTDKPGPELPFEIIMQLTLGMLGLLGTMRTVEKLKGKAK